MGKDSLEKVLRKKSAGEDPWEKVCGRRVTGESPQEKWVVAEKLALIACERKITLLIFINKVREHTYLYS